MTAPGRLPGAQPARRRAGTRRSGRPTGSLIAVIGLVLLLGVVAGALWAVITPTSGGRIVEKDSAVLVPERIPDEFGAVAVFALVMIGYGIVAAIVGWSAGRAWRGPVGFLYSGISVFLGALLAAWVGTAVADWRTPDPRTLPVGSTFDLVPELWLSGSVHGGSGGEWVLFLVAPCALALTYLVFALVTRHPDLGVGDGDVPAPVPAPLQV